MKLTRVFGVVAAGVLLQVALARFAIGGRFAFDFVMVGVVFAAVESGAVGGMLAGTLGGLLQDIFSGGTVGVSGLVNTIVGYLTGSFGTRFVVAKAHARALIVAAATPVHYLMVVGLRGVIAQSWPVIVWTAMLEAVVINAVVGWIAFYLTESVPGAMARGRSRRRPSLSRRQW